MSNGNIAVIGGTGLEQLPAEIFAEPVTVHTDSGSVQVLSVSNNYTEPYKLYFLSRHGAGHSVPPHLIDHHTNIEALCRLGVSHVMACNAVGALTTDLVPGTLVLLSDFIDYTRRRDATWRPTRGEWRHVDFSVPYSTEVRRAILISANEMGLPLRPYGTYLCVDGPRFETPAEVRLFRQAGADVVGMTGIPEAVFAREAGIEYASLAVVANLGAGLSPAPVDHAAVTKAVQNEMPVIVELFMRASGAIIRDRTSAGASEDLS